ncbi:MAG: N-methylhydantoinase A, partial [Planctomycetota bacterium]
EPRPVFTGPEPELIIEVNERLDASGAVIQCIDVAPAVAAAKQLAEHGVESFAVCLLHSYVNADHERQLTQALEAEGLMVTASSQLVPEFREFERFSTTFTNAGLMPLLAGYVADLRACGEELSRAAKREGDPSFFLMQSDGGVIGLDLAAKEPVRMVLSGPAGGVVGAWHAAATESRQQLITFDMGGTSTDVALLDGGEPVVGQAELAGRPLLVPVLDIHTVGAGGGSIARADLGGALLVGPASASSDPGPACYGHGGPATVTDAHLFLGRIPPHHFLGGEFKVDVQAAAAKIKILAEDLSLSPVSCALGILDVAEATMERALRRISLERGFDPRLFSLVCFGGAGALHAASLASKLELSEAIIPRDPGLLSAKGMLSSKLKREYSASLIGVAVEDLAASPKKYFANLSQRANEDMANSGVSLQLCQELLFCDLRYEGQSFAITVPIDGSDNLRVLFHQAHEKKYGFDFGESQRQVEVIALRLRMVGPAAPRPDEQVFASATPAEPLEYQRGFFSEQETIIPVYQRDDLGADTNLAGPVIVVEYSSTTVVPPGYHLTVDERANLIVRRSS